LGDILVMSEVSIDETEPRCSGIKNVKEAKDELLLASVQLTTRCLPSISFSVKATIDKPE
jgi:hypothetical protein